VLGIFRRWAAEPAATEPSPEEAARAEVLRPIWPFVDIVEQLEDAVLLVDEDSEITWVNPAVRRLFPQKKDPIGRSVLEVVRDHRLEALVQEARRTWDAQARDLDMPVEGRTLRAVARRLPAGMVCLTARDLTRLKHLETVRQSFVANLSHELRTPLAALDLAAQTLAADKSLGEESRVFAERVLAESRRLAAVIETLAQLAALDAENVTAQREFFSINALVRDNVERCQPRANERRLALRADLALEDVHAVGDRAKTEQALQAILDNAFKFTDSGEVVVSTGTEGDEVEIAVRDTGPGIPARDLPRIFERFYKVDRARSRAGSGLGLSIARHLVNLQGGSLHAESSPGAGTTMRIRLPRATSASD
jgi:two-component system phosphate regulon sensor histidine kinase PhoR